MHEEDFARAVNGYALTTAEILYRMPDHPGLLQTYLWQNYDLAPGFPRLTDFLDYWAVNLDGPLHSIRVAHKRLIKPQDFRFADGVLEIH